MFLTICILLAGNIHMNLGLPILNIIRLVTGNVRPLHNKSASITDLVIYKKLYILAFIETWLKPSWHNLLFLSYLPPNYSFYHQLRHSGRGGGVDFLVSIKFKVKSHSVQIYSTFKAVWIEISNCSFTGYFLCLYRSPGITSSFFVDFLDLLNSSLVISTFIWIQNLLLHPHLITS